MDAMRTFLRSTTIAAVVAIAAAVAVPPRPADAQVVAARWDRGGGGYHGRGHYHAPPRGPWFARPHGHHGWRDHGWHRHGWRHHGHGHYNLRPWAYRPAPPPYAYGYGYGYRY
jgi:hypothetical protein